jgi:hypothetical protein
MDRRNYHHISLLEFDKWYTEAFLDAEKVQTVLDAGIGHKDAIQHEGSYEDSFEKFERMKYQQLLSEQDLEPYNRAKEATAHRVRQFCT